MLQQSLTRELCLVVLEEALLELEPHHFIFFSKVTVPERVDGQLLTSQFFDGGLCTQLRVEAPTATNNGP